MAIHNPSFVVPPFPLVAQFVRHREFKWVPSHYWLEESMKVCGSESLTPSAVHNRLHDRLVHFRADDFVGELYLFAVAMKCFVA